MSDPTVVPGRRVVGRTPIGAVLEQLAAVDPHRPAVTDQQKTLTRAEFEASTNRLARAYRELGVVGGSFVTIALPSGVEFLESAVAVWKCGATPQPISHRMPPRELREIIALAEPALIVGLPSVDGYAAVPAGFVPRADLCSNPVPDAIAPSLKAPTSGGSTGRPKLIVSTEEATAEALSGFSKVVRIPSDGVLLSTGPLSHNGPLFTTLAGLVAGCHAVVMSKFDAARALELVRTHRVEWMYSVPTMLTRISDLPRAVLENADVATLRTVITMAAHCPTAVRDFCLQFFGPATMLELYAATEAHAIVTTDGYGWQERPGSVGRPVVGEIEVRDEAGAAVVDGAVGELWMRRTADQAGPYRYVGASAQRSDDGWETVGDLGRFDDDGYLYLADRKTDMIVVGGSNVYPAEVEAALEEHDAVTAACVVGFPDDDYGSSIHAVLNVSRAVGEDALVAHLSERLLPYKIPRTFERVEHGLRDEAGKTRRSGVRDGALARRSASGGQASPRSTSRTNAYEHHERTP